MQRERQTPLSSQPASRESSVPRQPDNKESERRDKRDDKVDEERLERQTQTIFDEYLGDLSSVEVINLSFTLSVSDIDLFSQTVVTHIIFRANNDFVNQGIKMLLSG